MTSAWWYLPTWYVLCKFGKQKRPLQTVLFLTDHCNLSCKHCAAAGHAGTRMKAMPQIREELAWSYEQGARFLDLEGGEPTLWRDGHKDINEVIRQAKEIGFYSVTVTTNAQRPFDWVEADSIWVSMDGVGSVHDSIRGQGAFAKLEQNLAKCGKKRVSANMAINRLNQDNVAQTVRYARDSPYLEQISLNFHTPYQGTEQLELPWADRLHLIDQIIELKKAKYPIMNSFSGLKLMKEPTAERPCWISNFILADGTRLEECPGKAAGVCSRCGFCMSGEMESVMRLKPDTILAGLKLRVLP